VLARRLELCQCSAEGFPVLAELGDCTCEPSLALRGQEEVADTRVGRRECAPHEFDHSATVSADEEVRACQTRHRPNFVDRLLTVFTNCSGMVVAQVIDNRVQASS
jgi:hypothetical protein